MSLERYLDANAGMPLRPEAREALAAALDLLPGNAASAHAAGRRARKTLSEAREAVAALVGAQPREVVFTSGATEANVLAVRGALAAAAPRRAAFVTTRAEHPSVLRLAERLETEGVRVLRAGVDRRGRYAAEEVARLADATTAAAALVLAQSVTGALEPVAASVAALRAGPGAGTFVHVDAAQAAGRVPLSLGALGAESLALASHKLGGPPGVGALVLRDGAAWTAPHGVGSQEGGRRPGTEAMPLAAAFGAAALAALRDLDAFAERARRQVARVAEFVRSFAGGEVITPAGDALPNTVLVAFDGCPGDALAAALDATGVRVSTGTACTSLARTPPEVLVAGGRTESEAARAIRVSVSWGTRDDDVDALTDALRTTVPRVRAALATS